MGIVEEDIARVREQSDIVAVITQYTQLRRVGKRFTGLCPFHSEKSGSFSVNFEEGLYYCFGCGAKGDTITFVREKEQLDFVGAVEWLANKFGVTLHYTDANEGEERKARARLYDALGKAVDFYHDRLLHAADAGAARSYLRQRGYNGDIVRRYRIGWAPEGWDHLAKALRLSNKEWIDSGLGGMNRNDRQYDFFRGRVLFPIFDAQERPMGFGGRILPGSDDARKYVNSADSGVYSKSRVLYGLNWAKGDIVNADEVIVCEGYTDVIGFHQAGAPRAVATCGTALTDEHVKLLRRFARRVVLSFDADTAGQNAAARFYEWEKRYDLEVLVADLPDGVDPGDLARSDPARLAAAVTKARPFLEFRVERALASGNLGSVEGRARTAESALAMVAEHPDRIVRDQYAYLIADRCRISQDLVRELAASGAAKVVESARNQVPRRVESGVRHPGEYEALKLIVHQRDEMLKLIVSDLFTQDLLANAFDAVVGHPTLYAAIEAAGPEAGDLLQRVSVEEPTSDPLDVACLLWRRFLDVEIAEGRREAKGAVDPNDIGDINRRVSWLMSNQSALLDLDRRASAVDGLLAWVVHPPEEES